MDRDDWTELEKAAPAIANVANTAAHRHARRAQRWAYLSIALALVSIALSVWCLT